MEYGINVKYFTKEMGLGEAARLVAKAGFTKLDYTPDLLDDAFEKELKEALLIFDAYGLSIHQTHMPFNRYGRYGDKHRLCLERCAEAAEMTGAKYIVAHGDEFDFENLEFSPEAALEYNHNYFLPYVERAKKSGKKLAFETVFEDWDRRRYTSSADELLSLIRSFNSENVVCCWDFGHANVTFKRQAPSVIERIGSLIECVHFHDNVGIDSHQMAMTGNIDWSATVSAFKSFGYNGVLSVEYSHGKIPKELAEDFIALTYKSAKYVWEKY